ncbi:40S ribosomal protein S21 [Lates japonicus]|nr:40S ribosomal protein S21 [Lates japonicus]
MNFIAFLCLLGGLGTVYGNPVCPENCKYAPQYVEQYFKHVSELSTASIAPWSLQRDNNESRLPRAIDHAVCHTCNVTNMIAMPIYFQIAVYQNVGNNTWCSRWRHTHSERDIFISWSTTLPFLSAICRIRFVGDHLYNLSNMQNDAGEFVDLYVPRKCSASNRIIGAKDHASIQINIAEVDKVTGRFNGQFKTYAICGAIRRMGESDDSILRLAKNDTIVAKNF